MSNSEPLWLRLRNHPKLFCLHMHPAQVDVLLRLLACEIEHRCDDGRDLDPIETAEWLQQEAEAARQAAAELDAREASLQAHSRRKP